MKILRIELGEFKSDIYLEDTSVDPGGVTVLFGANGAGKSTVLEAISWLFEDAPTGETLPRQRPGGSELPHSYPGWAVIKLDHWREDDSLEQQVLWKVLTNPETQQLLFWGESDQPVWEALSEDRRATLEEAFGRFPEPCGGAAELARLIDAWSDILAEVDDRAAFVDRRLLAQCLIEQAIFATTWSGTVLWFVPTHVSADAVVAANRIAAAGSAWDRDPVFLAAQRILEEPIPDKPTPFFDGPLFAGEFLEPARISELEELFASVWRVDASTDRLLEELLQAPALPFPAAEVAKQANDVAPSFVRDQGSIEIGVAGSQTLVRFHEHDGETWPVGDLGDGLKRWVAISALTAMRLLQHPDAPGLYLIDEPEAHLHLGAIRSLRQWLVARNGEGIGCVVATHALELLDLPMKTAQVMLVTRDQGVIRLKSITDTLLGSLQTHADALGITRADALRTVRAILIVEGKQDEQVLRHFFGKQLDEHRVIIHYLYGVDEALSLAELQYLDELRLPMVTLWDNVRKDLGEVPGHERSKEDKIRQTFDRLCSPVTLVSHEAVDIIATLPEPAVKTILGESFPGWDTIVDDWQRLPARPNFKRYMHTSFGRPMTRSFIAEVLEQCGDSRPSPDLERAMEQAFAELDRAAHPLDPP